MHRISWVGGPKPEVVRQEKILERSMALGFALFTLGWLLTLLLPETQSGGDINPDALGEPEIRDSWRRILLAVIAIFAVLTLGFSSKKLGSSWPNIGRLKIRTSLVYSIVVVTIVGFLWDADPFNMWTGLEISSLSTATLLLFCVMVSVFTHQAGKRVLSLASTLIAMFVLASAFTLPGLIRDSGHFEFVSEELSYVAAGKIPQLDATSQYTSIFPWIFSPALRAFPGDSAMVLLIGLAVLQVLLMAVVIKFGLGILKSPNSHAQMVAVLSVSAAPFLVSLGVEPLGSPDGRSFLSVASYFQVFPLRVFFPILGAFFLWRGVCYTGGGESTKNLLLVLSGFSTFLALVNNAEFGIPTTILIWGLVLFLGLRGVLRFANLVTFAASFLAPTTAVLLVFRDNLEALIENYFYFLTVFGLQGYLAVSAPLFGIHFSFMVVFLGQIFIGSSMMGQTRKPPTGYRLRQAVALLLSGGLGLISISYYLGRSLPPTAISGSTVFLALSASTMVPLLWFSLRVFRASAVDRPRIRFSAIPVFAGAIVVSTIAIGVQGLERQLVLIEMTARSIADHTLTERGLSSLTSEWGTEDFSANISRWIRLEEELAITSEAVNILKSLGSSPGSHTPLRQLLPMSNLVQAQTGVPSSLVFSHPSYLDLEDDTTDRQCRVLVQQTKQSGSSWFLMRDNTWGSLVADGACDLVVVREIEFQTPFPNPVNRSPLVSTLVLVTH